MTSKPKAKAANSKTIAERAPAPAKRASRPSRLSARPTSTPRVLLSKVNKRDRLAAMLLRDEGATVDQMVLELGWLPHTVRAAMTGLKKIGYAIDSDKIDGLRTYRAVAPK